MLHIDWRSWVLGGARCWKTLCSCSSSTEMSLKRRRGLSTYQTNPKHDLLFLCVMGGGGSYSYGYRASVSNLILLLLWLFHLSSILNFNLYLQGEEANDQWRRLWPRSDWCAEPSEEARALGDGACQPQLKSELPPIPRREAHLWGTLRQWWDQGEVWGTEGTLGRSQSGCRWEVKMLYWNVVTRLVTRLWQGGHAWSSRLTW